MHSYTKKHVCVPPVPQHSIKGERLSLPDLLAVPPFPLFPKYMDSGELGICHGWCWWSRAATFAVHGVGIDHVQARRASAGDSVLLRLAAVSVGIMLGYGSSAL